MYSPLNESGKYDLKCILIRILLASMTVFSACSLHQESTSDSSLYESENASQSATMQSKEEAPTTTMMEVSDSSDYAIYTDMTVPHGDPVIEKVEDVYAYVASEVEFGLGLGNPAISDNVIEKYTQLSGKSDQWIQECERSNLLDCMDYLIPKENASDRVGYYEIWTITQNCFFSDTKNGDYAFDMDLIRYIMSQNNLRFWIDELPYSLFETMFPDYIKLYTERLQKIRTGSISRKDDDFESIVCSSDSFFYFVRNLHGSFKNADDSYFAEISENDLRGLIYRQMSTYNRERMVYLLASRNFSCKQIEIGRTPDGKYVAVPTKEQYEKVMGDFHGIPECENLDILKVETRDDLVDAGIDVDKYDKLFDRIE